MKLKEVTIEQVKNLGNYESARLGVTAELGEGDSLDAVANDLKFYVDFKLNQDVREHKLGEINRELESGKDEKGKELSPAAIKQRKGWISHYERAWERFNALEFIHGQAEK